MSAIIVSADLTIFGGRGEYGHKSQASEKYEPGTETANSRPGNHGQRSGSPIVDRPNCDENADRSADQEKRNNRESFNE